MCDLPNLYLCSFWIALSNATLATTSAVNIIGYGIRMYGSLYRVIVSMGGNVKSVARLTSIKLCNCAA